MVPEYAGTALGYHSLGTIDAGSDTAQTARALRAVLGGSDVRALAAGAAQDANTFVVDAETASRHDLRTLSDLATVADKLVFGGPVECASRPLCLLGLEQRYGITFADVVTLDAGGPLTHQALKTGSIDVALLFTTDPALDDYVELVDDKRLQPAENVTPLIHDEVVERWGADVVEPLEQVSRLLSTRGTAHTQRCERRPSRTAPMWRRSRPRGCDAEGVT